MYTSSFQPGESKEYQMFIKAKNVHENPNIASPQEHTSDSINITIDGSDVPEPVVTYPNGGETFVEGDTHTLTWNFTAISDSVDLEVLGGQSSNVSTVQWTKRVLNNGEYSLTIPDVLQEDENGSDWVYKFRVKSFKDNGPGIDNVIGTYYDESNAFFNINDPNDPREKTYTLDATNGIQDNSFREYVIDVADSGAFMDANLTISVNGSYSEHLEYLQFLLISPQNSRILLAGGNNNNTSECSATGGCINSNSGTFTNTNFDDSKIEKYLSRVTSIY